MKVAGLNNKTEKAMKDYSKKHRRSSIYRPVQARQWRSSKPNRKDLVMIHWEMMIRTIQTEKMMMKKKGHMIGISIQGIWKVNCSPIKEGQISNKKGL